MDSDSPVAIETLLRELNVSFVKSGKEAVAHCPYHSPDKHASWSINTQTGLHHCFSCGASGNLAHLVSHIKNIPYSSAAIEINQTVGWARSYQWREDYDNKNFSPQTFKVSEADMAMFTDIPQEVLAGRRIERSTAELFGVRYNPANHSWILPIRDPYSDELWGWQEKFISERHFRNYPIGITKSKTLFGLDAFTDGSTAVVVESPIDAMRVSTFGAGSGLACSGLQISDFQLSLVFERSDNTVLALDSDNAGVRETGRICREYQGRSNFWVFDYGDTVAKDPGEMDDIDIILGFANAISGIRWLRDNKERLEKLDEEYYKENNVRGKR